MYDIETRRRALALVAQGRSLNSVSKETGISRYAIRSWQTKLEPTSRAPTTCARCSPTPHAPPEPAAYVYLLGLYLGDGHIIHYRKHRSPSLSIACGDAWPGLIDAAAESVSTVFPNNKPFRVRGTGCTYVKVYSKHLPCLFPQHGPGKKHERLIALQAWQQDLVDAFPWRLLAGLIHSDGCRITNWTTRVTNGVTKRYEYPRYFFTNTSADIRQLFTDTLDKVGVEWKSTHQSRKAPNISVARRASVALMDAHIGPKY
ncbi:MULTISPECIES: helix-turn-helix domain-containing protein [Streptomyces]|uniref:Helix-turn-helix domain-containing protein n=1 Tax=Streptomyces luteosporeus TaxID=173856 RepID=A0ABP6GD84_9ACTN